MVVQKLHTLEMCNLVQKLTESFTCCCLLILPDRRTPAPSSSQGPERLYHVPPGGRCWLRHPAVKFRLETTIDTHPHLQMLGYAHKTYLKDTYKVLLVHPQEVAVVLS